MKRYRNPWLVFLTLLLASAAAWAATDAELTARSAAAELAYADLEERVEVDVEDHAVLESESDALEAERAELWTERNRLAPGCDCDELDDHLANIDALSDEISRHMGGWDESE